MTGHSQMAFASSSANWSASISTTPMTVTMKESWPSKSDAISNTTSSRWESSLNSLRE